MEYNAPIPWEVEYTDEFGQWWHKLSEGQQDAVAARVELLMEHGPNLPYPYRRTSILIIGGDKTGNDRFYEEYVPVADDLYDEHLEELRKGGLIK